VIQATRYTAVWEKLPHDKANMPFRDLIFVRAENRRHVVILDVTPCSLVARI
jgi:hypothetical protein